MPPQKLLLPDSTESPSEDFANHVETYSENPEKIKQLNINSFNILEAIIKNKEKL